MTDIACFYDMDLFASETEDAAEELEQDCAHVIEQDLGSNLDDPTRGVGVGGMASSALPSGLERTAEQQLEQDDRVATATVSIEVDDSNPAQAIVTMVASIQPSDGTLEAIDLHVPIGTSSESAA